MSYPTPNELTKMYAERELAIQNLAAAEAIEVTDLIKLDRIGRYRVVTELWSKCTSTTKAALRGDEHSHVRSAASLER